MQGVDAEGDLSRMRAVSDLDRLRRASHHRLARLRRLLDAHVEGGNAASDVALADRATAFVAIEALNLWTEFVRSFYLSCVSKARTTSGTRVGVAITFASHQDALTFAIIKTKPNKLGKGPPWKPLDEPPWRSPTVLLNLDKLLMFTNGSCIVTGLSYPSTVLNQLPAFRNFFCHRNAVTAREVKGIARALGSRPTTQPEKILQSTPVGPVSHIGVWVADIAVMIELMCA